MNIQTNKRHLIVTFAAGWLISHALSQKTSRASHAPKGLGHIAATNAKALARATISGYSYRGLFVWHIVNASTPKWTGLRVQNS
jgi:hypothetical protein